MEPGTLMPPGTIGRPLIDVIASGSPSGSESLLSRLPRLWEFWSPLLASFNAFGALLPTVGGVTAASPSSPVAPAPAARGRVSSPRAGLG
ncbi:hypothetical protein D3C85_1004860 [compost metagenome]